MIPALLIKICLALAPLPLVYFLYHRYFQLKPGYSDYAEAFLFGLLLAGVLPLLSGYLLPSQLMQVQASPLFTGFIKAALVEKGGALLVLYFIFRKQGQEVIVLEAGLMAMMFGIGFSALENIFYAIESKNTSVILVRFLSAVPLHVTTCGIMGYYLGLMRISSAPPGKYFCLLRAIVIPYTLHGLYDTLLFTGGGATLMIGALLVVMIVLLEFLLARSQTLPSLQTLEAMELRFEEWNTVQKEPQYERWILRSMGDQNEDYTPFLRSQFDRKTLLLLVLTLTGTLAFYPFKDVIFEILKITLPAQEQITLFVVMPLSFALNILFVGSVNPAYFRNSIIRIPIIADVLFSTGDRIENAITYDITAAACLLKTVDEFTPGDPLELHFICPGFSSPDLKGKVSWDNHINPAQPSGTVIRFDSIPKGYYRFLFRYFLFKILRGLSFNLKLPGFETIRQFFVRPLSVMQKEKKFPPGTILFEEGDAGKNFYLIRKGEVEIFKTIQSGQKAERLVMSNLSEGDIFGELALVGNQPRSATARCKTECILAVAQADNLEALIKSNPAFTTKIIQILSNRLHSSEKILSQNLALSEQTAKNREIAFYTALNMLLIGAGYETLQNTFTLKVDTKRIARATGLPPGAINSMFELLMRFDTQLNLSGEDLERYFSHEFLDTYYRYKLVIEEGEETTLPETGTVVPPPPPQEPTRESPPEKGHGSKQNRERFDRENW